MTPARPLLALAAAALLWSCRSERPAPPPESEPSPAASLRPLTSRDASGSESPLAPPDSAAPAASLPPGHPPLGGTGATTRPAAPGESVAGTITIAPALSDRAGGGVLFVIARGADKQIVAVRREDVAKFPFSFSISAADAMVAGTSFKGPLDITARLSKSGDAVAAKGDLEGVARGVEVGARDVKVTIDRVRE